MKTIIAILITFVFFTAAKAQNDIAVEASVSALTQTSLPNGSLLIREGQIPSEYVQLFNQFIASDPKSSQGKMEVFVINNGGSKKSDAERLRRQFETSVQNAGWVYEIHGQENNITFFTAIKKTPARKNIFGYWIPVDKSMILAMTEVFYGKSDSTISDKSAVSNQTQGQNSSTSGQKFDLTANDDFVNVMGNKTPKIPSFPALPKKAGFLRGYVKDSAGNPLSGAYIGVRSTMIGGSYSGASAPTDAKGFYEIKLPIGAIHLYAAAYTVDYGDLRASLSLHPADGRLDGFASTTGDVENFVLFSYGIADRNKYSENPNGVNNYYGGAIRINYNLAENGDLYAPQNYIKENSEIEITFTPEGNLWDGSSGASFVIRKNVGNGMFFHIYNIPVGKYTITATLVKGNRPLFMRQSPRNKNNSGITPKETTGKASLIFEPNSAQDIMTLPAYGSWTPIDINLFLSK